MPPTKIFKLDEVGLAGQATPAAYREILRRASFSAGVYVIPANSPDRQSAHTEDEIYLVLRGRARFRCGAATESVAPGDMLFVEAQEMHRFEDVSEELVLAVFFAPPEGSSNSGDSPRIEW